MTKRAPKPGQTLLHEQEAGASDSAEDPPKASATATAVAPPVSSSVATGLEWLDDLDKIGEPVFVHDSDYRILRCNAAYAASAGLEMAEIVGKPYWQVFPKMHGPLAGCRKALESYTLEERDEFTTDTGEVYLSRDINSYGDDAVFRYSRHMLENVTAHRRREQALEFHSEFSQAIIGSAPGIFMVTDNDGRYIRWNSGLNEFTGLSDEELGNKSVWDVIPKEDRETFSTFHEEAAANGFAQGDIRLFDRERRPRDYFLSTRRFRIDETVYFAAFGIDRTEFKRIENELRREKIFSDAIIESAPGTFYVVDQNANLVRWNSAIKTESGLSDDELKGRSLLTSVCEGDRQLVAAKILAAFATGHAQAEIHVPTATRGIRTYVQTSRRLFLDGVPYLTGFGIDITERKQAEEACSREKSFSDALIESVPGAFYAIDTEGNYFRWNSFLNRLTGLSDDELRRTPSLMTIHEDDRPLAASTMRQAFETGYAQAELRVLTCERGVRVFFMTARRFQVGNAAYLVGVGIDTTDRIAKARELEHEAQTDPLTGVANRSYFMAMAAQEFARSRRYDHPLSIWMIDIDHFKNVNDTYGHHAGDIVLQKLIMTSRQTLRDWDVLGRMGGEEFAVLLPETDGSQALLVAERLRQAVAATPINVNNGTPLRINISIGVATQCDEDLSFENLLLRADGALYEAKRTGRDKVCVAEKPMPPEVSQR